MGLFKKKQEIFFEDKSEKTPIRFSKTTREQKLSGQEGGRLDAVDKKKRNKKIRRYVVLSLVVIILGLGGYFGYRAYSSLSKIFADGNGGVLNLLTGNTTQKLKGEESGRTNILLLGVGDEGHAGSTLSDTIILASIDSKTGSVAMFSVPRDLYVSIPGYGYSKINSAHAYGEQYKVKGGGPALAESTVAKAFDVPVHYYARVDFSGLKDAVDALGGVTVNVENSFCDYDYPVEYKGDTSTICFTKGPQTMNGIKALQFSRSRHSMQNNEGSDFARSKRQQKVIMAIKDKALSGGTLLNPAKVVNFLSALGNHVKTDFSPADFPRLIEIMKGVDASKIISKNFDNSPEGMLVSSSSEATGYILQPATGNFKAIQAVVKNIFAAVGVKNEKAAVSVYNGTWNSGLASRLSDTLKADGYNIVTTGDADTKNYQKTVIIDYSGGKKPETVKALEKYFGVSATTATQAANSQQTTTFEIKVVIGRDYQE